MQLSLTDLRLFVAVAELLNLTRAAERCHLSLPAVSNRIHAIEEQVHCRLLLREARGVRMTPAGDAFARHARVMLLQAESLSTTLRDFSDGLQGQIIVLANTTATIEFLPAVLANFLSSHPLISVNLKEQANREIARGVREGRADLGVAAGDVDVAGLQSIHFATDRLVLVTARAHSLARQRAVSFAEVMEHPFVGMHEGSTLQDFLALRVEAMGRPQTRPRVQLNSFEALCLMVEAGVGLGIVPESVALRYRESMRIEVVPLTDHWAVRDRYLLMREGDNAPAFLHELVEDICAHHAKRR